MYKKILLLFSCLFSLLSVNGQTLFGLSSDMSYIPSAVVNADKTLTLGGNYLNSRVTNGAVSYNTYNYYGNITFLPFLEFAYACTLMRSQDSEKPNGYGSFRHQDRSVSVKWRICKEGRYRPAIAIGANDILTTSSFFDKEGGNQYMARAFAVVTKSIPLGSEKLFLNATYMYRKRGGNAFAAGIGYSPSFAKNMFLTAESDMKLVFLSAQYTFFKMFSCRVVLQDFKYLSAGIGIRFSLGSRE